MSAVTVSLRPPADWEVACAKASHSIASISGSKGASS